MWHVLLSGCLTFVVMLLFGWAAARTPPMQCDGVSGSVRPSRWLLGIGILIGFGVGLTALWAAAFAHGGFPATLVGVAFVVMVGIILPWLSANAIVRWDAHGLEGPTQSAWLIRRTRLQWNDLVGGGKTLGGYDYVHAADGRRIYWNSLYSGIGALYDALDKYSPLPPTEEEPSCEVDE